MLNAATSVKIAAELARVTAKIKRQGKASRHIGQAIAQRFADGVEQKIMRREFPRGTLTLAKNLMSIENANITHVLAIG
jgi:hypothetical protein